MTEQPEQTREFDLGDILSVSHGRMFSETGLDGIAALLRFMVGEPVYTHQLPRVADECAPELRKQLPFLNEVTIPDINVVGNLEQATAWSAEQYARYGRLHAVRPLEPGLHKSIDPVTELLSQTTGPVILVLVDEIDVNNGQAD